MSCTEWFQIVISHGSYEHCRRAQKNNWFSTISISHYSPEYGCQCPSNHIRRPFKRLRNI
ncbi:hypothetical protein Hdeb2414_s0204g00831791 [Helianthus debilis subsp. tardiflorus]